MSDDANPNSPEVRYAGYATHDDFAAAQERLMRDQDDAVCEYCNGAGDCDECGR